jgi:hypothetical protein
MHKAIHLFRLLISYSSNHGMTFELGFEFETFRLLCSTELLEQRIKYFLAKLHHNDHMEP